MKLGARILKTGIAITLALFLASFLNLPSPVFAGISAVFAIQPSIYRSYLSVVEQIQGNIIGAIIAILFYHIFGHDPFIIGLAVIIVIGINLKLKIENTISLSIVTVIAIMETPSEQFIEFSLLRFATIMLGILSAFLVNLIFLPPKYENKLYDKIVENSEEVFKWIRLNTRHASEYNILKADIEAIKENIIKIDQTYLLFKEERNYLKNNKVTKSRKLVLYRSMIVSLNRAFETLKKLHRFENELKQMPVDFQQIFIKEIDDLIHYHEQCLLRFAGKIKTVHHTHDELKSDLDFDKKKVIDQFLQQKETIDEENWHQVLSLVSSIIDYYEQLEHLSRLIVSHQTFHESKDG